jgi:TRAP-type C4-dicarboxylate transport system substrate-binding protein
MQRMRGRFTLTIVAVALAIGAAACTGDPATSDKAGGPGEPVTLTMATVNGDLDFTPQIQYLLDRAAQVSEGNVQIEVVFEVGDFAPDAEQQVVSGVADGEFDLGYVGTQGFEALGAENFVALTAPMLIDSYALEGAVIQSGVTDQMLQGLEGIGVTGLGVLAGALRKPVTVQEPLLGPADWQGITFGTFNSEGQAETVRALDATPMKVVGDERDRALEEGTIDGFESSLHAYRLNGQEEAAPYVAANVNLWPQTLAVVGNRDAIAGLSEQQRGWLHQAVEDAAERSTALVDTDASSLEASCDVGARFALASQTDLAALEEAFAPVYAALQQDPATQAFIAQILEIKESTPSAPSISIPSDCIGKDAEEASEQDAGGTGSAPAFLNGTYRWVLTEEDAEEVGDPETNYPHINTITLKDGHLEDGCFGAGGGTYSVEGDRITFYSVEYDGYTTVTFSVDDDGSLHLTPVLPMDPGTAFECYKPWRKIG